MISQEILEYQSLDGELTRIEKDLRKNENYVKSRKYKALWREIDESLSVLDARTADLHNQLVQAHQTVEKLSASVEEYSKEIENVQDDDELNYISKKLNAQMELLASAEKDVKRIVKEAEEIAKTFSENSAKIPKIVNAVSACDAEFKKATESVKPRVAEIKKRQLALQSQIDKTLLEGYLKKHEQVHPVFVPLKGENICGGCQMDMPLAVVTSGFEQKGYVVCEHCGRIIYKN